MAKIKTYVITLSKNYMKGHPKAGQPTNFKEKFLSGKKIHTIRGNYPLWEKRVREVQEGKAILSIREWIGVPYKEKQVVIKDLTCDNGVGIQKLSFEEGRFDSLLIDGNNYHTVLDALANNDGLSFEDFRDWFKKYNLLEPMAIIHFTKFRY